MKSKDPIRVLLVDDHISIVDAWLRIFATVDDIDITHTAITIHEALKALEAGSFDVAVVDMEIPRHDLEGGLRLIEAQAKKPGAPRFLAISGVLLNKEFILRVAHAGAVGYVRKNTSDYEQYFDAIRNVHRGHLVFPPDTLRYMLTEKPTWLQLTDQEKRIWQLIAEGKTNREIGAELNYSEGNVKSHASELYSKLGVANRTQASRKWMEEQYGMQEMEE